MVGHTSGVPALAFSPDGHTLAVSGGDSPVLGDVARLAEVVARPLDVALAITGRTLDQEEWERHAPDLPFRQDRADRLEQGHGQGIRARP